MTMDSLYAQHERASVTEMVQNMKTYPLNEVFGYLHSNSPAPVLP